MSVTKAIIPVAGYGTRRLPVTKAVEKCMLPIGNRPVVDYVVQDCIDAGIKEILFIVGEQSEQLQTYYGQNDKLNEYLLDHDKEGFLDEIQPPKGVQFRYITQPAVGKHGTAAAVALAFDYIEHGESVAVLTGDDFFYNSDGSSEIARLLDATPENSNAILAAVLSVDDSVTGRYGSIEEDSRGNLIRITEHPETLPQPFIKNVSKYILNYSMLKAVWEYVETETPDGEYYIFTPFEQMIANGEVMKVVSAQGQYLDGGNLAGWLYANQVVGADLLKS